MFRIHIRGEYKKGGNARGSQQVLRRDRTSVNNNTLKQDFVKLLIICNGIICRLFLSRFLSED